MSMTKGTPASSQIIWLEQRLKEIEAENEALRADAERYRWLRDPANAYRDEWDLFGPYSSAEEIDTAIDAARSKP